MTTREQIEHMLSSCVWSARQWRGITRVVRIAKERIEEICVEVIDVPERERRIECARVVLLNRLVLIATLTPTPQE